MKAIQNAPLGKENTQDQSIMKSPTKRATEDHTSLKRRSKIAQLDQKNWTDWLIISKF